MFYEPCPQQLDDEWFQGLLSQPVSSWCEEFMEADEELEFPPPRQGSYSTG